MKKLICILLSVLMLVAFASCTGGSEQTDNTSSSPEGSSSSNEQESSNIQKEVKLSEIKDKIISETNAENPIDVSSERLAELYGIDSADVAESACFVTSNGTFPEEAIMIKAKDADAQKRIAELLEARIADVKVQSENYDAENYALAQRCKVMTEGSYVAMFISAQHEKMESIFLESVK